MNKACRYSEEKFEEKAVHEYDKFDWEEENDKNIIRVMERCLNTTVTENGALGYKSSFNLLVDLNFKINSLRDKPEEWVIKEFIKSFYVTPKYTLKWLFYLRDIKEGLGERRIFRICLRYLANSHPQITVKLLNLISWYGRYDDYLCLLETKLCNQVCDLLKKQVEIDLKTMENEESVSLLAKWLPSVNTSSSKSKELAKILLSNWGWSEKKYRKTLAILRNYLDVVEVKMSDGRWNEIKYEKVPAKANLIYNDAFTKHDEKRRAEYLYKVLQGRTKLNNKGIAPYEIVHRFVKARFLSQGLKDDLIGELMWKVIQEEGFQNHWGLEDCIVVADGSGSMYRKASESSSVTAIEICTSLAIYFSEQLQGVFKDKVITFSERPQFINLGNGNSLKEKLEIMSAYNEVANTNVEAVFDLLLALAMDNDVSKEILPKQILIISDMEFDAATGNVNFNKTLFETIEEKYNIAGYKMPKLIFWNVCGRTNTIPKIENEQGICLLSGFSQNAIRVAAKKGKGTALENLIEVLDSSRYQPIGDALKGA